MDETRSSNENTVNIPNSRGANCLEVCQFFIYHKNPKSISFVCIVNYIFEKELKSKFYRIIEMAYSSRKI